MAPFAAGSFWVPAAIALTSVNGLSNIVPILVIALCSLLLACQAYVPLRRALGVSGGLILAALASYSVIGFVTAIAADGWRSGLLLGLLVPAYAILLIYASAVGSWAMESRMGIERLLLWLLVILTVACVTILASAALNPKAERFVGLFADPNNAGLIAGITVALALSFLATGRWRALAYTGLSVGFTAALATFSRTAILSLIALVAFFLVSNRRILGPLFRWLIVMALAGLVASTTVGVDKLALKPWQLMRLVSVVTVLSGQFDDSLTSERITLWRLGLEKYRESPIIGNGLGALGSLEGASFNWNDRRRQGVHNFYLLLAGEAGVVPAVLYVLFILSMLRLRWTASPSLARDVVVSWTILIALYSFVFHHLLTLSFFSFLIGVNCTLAAGVQSSRGAAPPADRQRPVISEKGGSNPPAASSSVRGQTPRYTVSY